MAVPAGAAVGLRKRGVHHVGRHVRRVQVDRPGRGRATLGRTQEQAEHELRQTQSRSALLLRQKHHDQGLSVRNALARGVWGPANIKVTCKIFIRNVLTTDVVYNSPFGFFPAKMIYVLQLLGDYVPQAPYRGFSLDPTEDFRLLDPINWIPARGRGR